MDIAAIILARVLAFVEIQDLNPYGRAFYPEIASALVNRFNFQVFPQKPEDFNEQAGITFTDGKIPEGTIDRLQIFSHGVVVDTRISTDVSVKLLHETLLWAKDSLHLRYEERMIKRVAYVSQLTFQSDLKLDKLNPILEKASSYIDSRLAAGLKQTLKYETTGFVLNLDQSTTKLTPSSFTLERRIDIPFQDNKYFSTAPLQTQDHVLLLQELEKALL
jgi:hypothetical protein